jgi:hypothetical protein
MPSNSVATPMMARNRNEYSFIPLRAKAICNVPETTAQIATRSSAMIEVMCGQLMRISPRRILRMPIISVIHQKRSTRCSGIARARHCLAPARPPNAHPIARKALRSWVVRRAEGSISSEGLSVKIFRWQSGFWQKKRWTRMCSCKRNDPQGRSWRVRKSRAMNTPGFFSTDRTRHGTLR